MNRVLAFLVLSATFCTGYLLGLAVDNTEPPVRPESTTFKFDDGSVYECFDTDGSRESYEACQRIKE